MEDTTADVEENLSTASNSKISTRPTTPFQPMKPSTPETTNQPTSQQPKKRKNTNDEFENVLLSKLDNFISIKSSQTVSESRFGDEVAEQLCAISSDYDREVAKRQIRDILFTARFNSPSSQTSDSPSFTQLF